MTINLLGPIEVRNGRRAAAIKKGKQRALLAGLSLSPGAVVPTGRLIEILWDGMAPPTAQAKVYAHVSELRKVLGGADRGPAWPVVTCQAGYQLSRDGVRVDYCAFRDTTAAARRAAQARDLGAASGLYAEALGLWRGPALVDVESEILRSAATAWNETRLLAVERKADTDLQLGRNDDVVDELMPLAAAFPLRERLRGSLMLALYRRGCRSEALETYRSGYQALADELGLPPCSQLRRLQQLIYRDDPSLWRSPPDALWAVQA